MRSSGWRRAVAVQLAMLPLWLLVLELLFRGGLFATGASYDSATTAAAIERIGRGVTERLPIPDLEPRQGRGRLGATSLNPFVGYWKASQADFEVRERESPRDYQVLVLGGSVAAMVAILGERRLVETLQADPLLEGRTVRVLNYGSAGFKQPQQLNLLSYLLSLGFAPDAVVNLDGFNEVAEGNENARLGVHPLYPLAMFWTHLARTGEADRESVDLLLAVRSEQRGAARLLETVQRFGLVHSAVLGTVARRLLEARQARWAAAQVAYAERVAKLGDSAVRGPVFDPDVGAVVATAVRSWTESSRSLQAICDERGIYYLHVLQPTMLDTGSKPLTEEETRLGVASPGWTAGARAGYPRLRAAGERLIAGGVNFFDGSRLFVDVGETLYGDPCHLNAKGNELLADALARAFLDGLREKRLGEASSPAGREPRTIAVSRR